MTTKRCSLFLLFLLATNLQAWSDELSPAEQTLTAASNANQFTFILFYRTNDARLQAIRRTLATESARRTDTTVVTIAIDDITESRLIQRFDATRTPMPAVVAIAPNNAVTGVFPQRFTVADFRTAIVTPSYADCVKALQNDRLVLLCIHPAGHGTVPTGVAAFQADKRYGNRTRIVNVAANDPAEAPLLKEFGIATTLRTPMTVFLAPPGVMVGKFDARVTAATLAAKLAEAGKCCDDPNCNHGRRSASNRSPRKR